MLSVYKYNQSRAECNVHDKELSYLRYRGKKNQSVEAEELKQELVSKYKKTVDMIQVSLIPMSLNA